MSVIATKISPFCNNILCHLSGKIDGVTESLEHEL